MQNLTQDTIRSAVTHNIAEHIMQYTYYLHTIRHMYEISYLEDVNTTLQNETTAF